MAIRATFHLNKFVRISEALFPLISDFDWNSRKLYEKSSILRKYATFSGWQNFTVFIYLKLYRM